MKVIYSWEAFDGKIFSSESECYNYEAALKEKSLYGRCISFDENFQILDPKKENASYLYLADEEAVEWLKEVYDIQSIITDGLWEPDLYLWDNDAIEWCPIQKRMKELNTAKEKILEAVRKMKGDN